ncbi:MAG: GNAT family N-acetyltransferase [Spirochaetales bacterium]|nr:GNAT family N-acetyltransferase [Spirochaetales bacterium]
MSSAAPGSSGEPAGDRADFFVRPARQRDIAAITRLNAQLGYPETTETIAMRFSRIRRDRRNNRVFVAVADAVSTGAAAASLEPVVGWIHVFIDRLLTVGPRAEVGGIVVDEAWRGRGVGAVLLRQAEVWALSRNISQVVIHTNVVRGRAHKFYERYGYHLLKQSRVYIREID